MTDRHEDATARIDSYVAGLAEPFASAIAHLRQTIRAAVPEAEEIITYSMPGLGFFGPLVSYRAFKKHCSLFPMGNAVLRDMETDIALWRTSTGTLQFSPTAPLPDDLVTRIVLARAKENRERQDARRTRPRRAPDSSQM